MHAHGVQVLDGADDDAVVGVVAHHLHLEFFPPDQGFLDEQFLGGRGLQAPFADGDELFHVVGDATATAAHGEGRPDDGGKADARLDLQGFFHAVSQGGTGVGQADAGHGLLEFFPVFRLVDGILGCADQDHAVFFQHAVLGQVQGAVKRGLPPHGGQDGIRPFPFQDALHRLPVDGLDVGGVRHLRVGHDGGRVGVHQDDPVPLFLERLAGLGAGIVELAGLADDDGAGADDQDGFEVCTLGHRASSYRVCLA
jgi:hypothetical protein